MPTFAKIVEVFDAHGASFVSVTQHFNTATSMGRLTLNMLLSFAQFEREVTGERIRDKIAASKRKGIWMGGTVSLGYEVRDRKLVVNEAEAEIVRRMLPFVSRGWLSSRSRTATCGGRHPYRMGVVLGRGPLYHLLKNRTYRGEVAHKGNVYPGEQAAIIGTELWDQVQQSLTAKKAEGQATPDISNPGLLTGLLFDDESRPMKSDPCAEG